MRVWLDDVRPMPSGYTHWAKTAEEAIDFLKTGEVEEISLDHDLGDFSKTGYDVAKFIEEGAHAGTLASMRLKVHTQNPVGKVNIIAALRSAKLKWMEKNDG